MEYLKESKETPSVLRAKEEGLIRRRRRRRKRKIETLHQKRWKFLEKRFIIVLLAEMMKRSHGDGEEEEVRRSMRKRVEGRDGEQL